MTIPSGALALFDCRQTSTIKNGGSPAAIGGLVDTAGNLTQPTSANQPTYDDVNLLGGPCLVFGAGGQPNFNVETFVTSVALAMGVPFTIAVFGRINAICVLAEMFQSAGVRGQIYSTIDTTAISRGNTTQIGDALGQPWNDSNLPVLTVFSSDGTAGPFPYTSDEHNTGLALTKNGVYVPMQLAGGAPGTNAGTPTFTVGADHTGATQVTGVVGFAAIWPRNLSSSDRALLLADIQSGWIYPNNTQTKSRNTIAVGDSLTAAWYTSNTNAIGTTPDPSRVYSFINRAIANLGTRFGVVYNIGVGGASLTVDSPVLSVLSQWTTLGVAAVIAGMVNVISVEGGTNNLLAGQTAATVWGHMQTVLNQIVSDLNGVSGGPHHIFVSNVTWIAGYSPASAITDYNALVIANAPGIGTSNVHIHVVDVGDDIVLGDQTRGGAGVTVYFHDTTHETYPGQERWAALTMAQLLAAGL